MPTQKDIAVLVGSLRRESFSRKTARALQALAPRQRAALVLRYYEDLTEAQTAEAMGCAVGTVKSQVSAGLGNLRRQLGDDVELVTNGNGAAR